MVTLEDCRDFLGITDGSKDNALILLINAVTQDAKSHCNRTFKGTSYTSEAYTGSGSPFLITKQAPITTVTSLVAEPNGAALTAGALYDYVIEDADAGIIRLTNGIFIPNVHGVTLSYTAGWATLPADLYYSALEAVSFRLTEKEQNRVGVQSVTTVDGITTYTTSPYPQHIIGVWNRYVRGGRVG
jgi:hypothetical protein